MRRTGLSILGVALALGAAVVASALAFSPSGPATGFRVSFTGADGDTTDSFADFPAVAYNSARQEYLVVFEADEATEGEVEIFGQRISGKGKLLGGVIRVSNTGTEGDGLEAGDPAVAYNSKTKQYLVVFESEGTGTSGETEIFGQRIGGTGASLGGDFRISTTGAEMVAARDAFSPDVAYNVTSNQYLVVFQGDGFGLDNENEIFGQRLSATGGELDGDFRISTQGAEADASRDSTEAAVAYGTKGNQYLVAFRADPFTNDNEFEVFGQRLSAGGGDLGGDFQISTTGPDGDDTNDAFNPDVAYHAGRSQFLAVWEANPFTGTHFDIFGQALSTAGAKLGGGFQVSTSGPSSDENLIGTDPALAYNSRAKEFLATWEAFTFPDTTSPEIYGQRIGARGRQLDGDFRISTTGTDGDVSREAELTDVAGGLNHYLVAWGSDGFAPDEFEVFARRIVAPKCFGKAPTLVGTKKKDKLKGTGKADVIVGLGGPDTLIGRGGPDRLCGNKGNDTVRGGKGRDRTRR